VGSVCKGSASPVRVARPLAMTKDAHTRAAGRCGGPEHPLCGVDTLGGSHSVVDFPRFCPPTTPCICDHGTAWEADRTIRWELRHGHLGNKVQRLRSTAELSLLVQVPLGRLR